MPIDPVKIPQNVYVEERIIGPVTLKQIFLLLGGGGVSYALYAGMKASTGLSFIGSIVAWSPLVICAAFAFVKINDLTLMRILLLSMEKTQKPPKRYWSPRKGVHISARSLVPNTKAKDSGGKTAEEEAQQVNAIEQLGSVLDSGPIQSLTPTPDGQVS